MPSHLASHPSLLQSFNTLYPSCSSSAEGTFFVLDFSRSWNFAKGTLATFPAVRSPPSAAPSSSGRTWTWYLNLPLQACGSMFHLESHAAWNGPSIVRVSKLCRNNTSPRRVLVPSLGAPKRRRERHSGRVLLLQEKTRKETCRRLAGAGAGGEGLAFLLGCWMGVGLGPLGAAKSWDTGFDFPSSPSSTSSSSRNSVALFLFFFFPPAAASFFLSLSWSHPDPCDER